MEQLTGKRMYMTHRMQPIFTTKFAGYAVTVKLVKEENHDPNALTPSSDGLYMPTRRVLERPQPGDIGRRLSY